MTPRPPVNWARTWINLNHNLSAVANTRTSRPTLGQPIEELRPLPADPNMRRVRVNGSTVATLRASDVEQLNLAPGVIWTAQLAAMVDHLSALQKARKLALSMLARSSRTAQQIITRLVERGHDRAVAEHIAGELAANHWIDDERYAHDFAQTMMRNKPAAAGVITDKLTRRGVDAATARRAARDATAPESPEQVALALAQQKLLRMGKLSRPVQQRRIASLLGRRGFDEDVIDATLERLSLAPQSDD
jgi:SOS response regulatory protein OraA/RecX